MTLEDGLTNGNFIMSIGDAGEQPLSSAGIGNKGVDRTEEHLKRVRKPLNVSGGIIGVGGNIGSEAGGGPQRHFVGPVTISELDPFRIFGAPPGRSFGAVNLDSDAILTTGRYLGDRQIAARSIAELEEHVSKVVGLNLIRGIFDFAIGFGKRLNFSKGSFARLMPGAQLGEDRGNSGAEDKANSIQPMRADVGHGSEFASLLWQQAPVVIGLLEQPVLQVRTIHMYDLA